MHIFIGQIGYALSPMIARGVMLGPDQPVILHLLDIPPAAQALEGVRMELIDAAYPLVKGETLTSRKQRRSHDQLSINSCMTVCHSRAYVPGVLDGAPASSELDRSNLPSSLEALGKNEKVVKSWLVMSGMLQASWQPPT